MKKALKGIFALFLVLTVLTGCTKNDPTPSADPGTENIKIGFVTDVGGIEDKSFNQTSYAGIKQFAAEIGLVEGTDIKYLQSADETDYIPNLSAFAAEEMDLIVAAGFLFEGAISELVANYPDQKVLIIDVGWLEGENLAQATFAEHEGSFLVGVVAGLMAKQAGKDKVGYVVGMDSVTMDKFEAGYQAGVWAVYPECTIYRDNANNFTSSEIGKTLAAKQYAAGAYVVYHAAGGSGMGVIQEAAERREAGEDVWVIGVDTDQYDLGTYGDGSQSAVLTSMLKRVDVASYNAAKAVYEGTFTGGVTVYDLKANGVGLPENNPNVPADILAEALSYVDKIVSGEIVVPETPVKSTEDNRVIGNYGN